MWIMVLVVWIMVGCVFVLDFVVLEDECFDEDDDDECGLKD